MAELTDQEIVAACARAMGQDLFTDSCGQVWVGATALEAYRSEKLYDPLTDRAQALELVEKLRLRVIGSGPPYSRAADPVWIVEQGGNRGEARDTNLLRAICLCAARVQIEKEKNRA